MTDRAAAVEAAKTEPAAEAAPTPAPSAEAPEAPAPEAAPAPAPESAPAPEAAPAPEPEAPAPALEPEAPAFDVTRRATELAILEALRAVVDPELGLDVVDLALIRQIVIGPESTEIKMVLTTPFCPYAGWMIQQIKDQAESVLEHPVKVTLLAERWDPRDAGLMW